VASDDLRRADFAVALRKHRPIVLVFDTARCQSRICGPVVDEARQVRSELGGRVTFVYMDIYRDGVPGRGLRPQVKAWRLRGGPFVYAIDRRGVIATRIEGAFSVPELRAAARKALR
jgi:hypothetical protein